MKYNQLELSHLFFKELKQYNTTNFRTLQNADLSKEDAIVHKAFSSVVTRFFIFVEKHPELSSTDIRILYFKLKIDMIARYFSEYPEVDMDQLRPFQTELKNYVKDSKSSSMSVCEVSNNESKTA